MLLTFTLITLSYLSACTALKELPTQPQQSKIEQKKSDVQNSSTVIISPKKVLGLEPDVIGRLNDEIFTAAEKSLIYSNKNSKSTSITDLPCDILSGALGILDQYRSVTNCIVLHRDHNDVTKLYEFSLVNNVWTQGEEITNSKKYPELQSLPATCDNYQFAEIFRRKATPVHMDYWNFCFSPSGYYAFSKTYGQACGNAPATKGVFSEDIHYTNNNVCAVNDVLWQSKICTLNGLLTNEGFWTAIALHQDCNPPARSVCTKTIICDMTCGLGDDDGARLMKAYFRVNGQIGTPAPIEPLCTGTSNQRFLLWDDIPGAVSYQVYVDNNLQNTITAMRNMSYAQGINNSAGWLCGGKDHTARVDVTWACRNSGGGVVSQTTVTGAPVTFTQ